MQAISTAKAWCKMDMAPKQFAVCKCNNISVAIFQTYEPEATSTSVSLDFQML